MLIMSLKKNIKRIVLPAIIILFAVAVVAQITTGKNILGSLFTKKTVDTPTDETGDKRRVTGDDPWKELENIYRVFNEGKNVFYSGKITLQDEDDDKLLEEVPYSCEINGPNYHYTIDSVEMIYSGEIALNVYHREKLMVLGKGKVQVKNWWTFSSIDSVRKYAMLDSAEVKVMQDGSMKLISVENTGNPDIYAYEMYYDPATYRLSRLVIFFASLDDFESQDGIVSEEKPAIEKPQNEDAEENEESNTIYVAAYRMQLIYENFSVREGLKDFAPENKFISINKKKLTINDEYKDYRVIVPDTKQKD